MVWLGGGPHLVGKLRRCRKRARSWHTARQWAQAARREGRVTNPLPEDLVAEVTKLRHENHKLRDTNELLKAASAFSHRNQAQSLGYDPVYR